MAATPRIELDTTDPHAIDGRHIRALAFQDVRLAYLRELLTRLDIAPSGRNALVVGNGHGPLADSLAGLGFETTAVDPSPAAVELAATASKSRATTVTHTVATAEELPLEPDAFGLVHLADTLEVTENPARVIAEAARVLAPGGVLTYDTVNRTWLAKLIYLGAFQRFRATRIMPPTRYSAARLRPPTELAALFTTHGLTPGDVRGFKPRSPLKLVTATRSRVKGRITDEQIPPLVDFETKGAPLVTYFGYALGT
ncbi:class I SAM-dependent methyltransferase [Yinghuangia seranimata]|uniref:class I SAM-dependent methyltransferase n=1 Tax=Yinghuangia seranimata TaxID=408067 RepID=UPI00248BFF50|nr:methyltransferase domain-containing protein [Yinghuangia seranimata]MDI2130275.1 methyltransferase domain-containing protein [Yinghuangia seranimata]